MQATGRQTKQYITCNNSRAIHDRIPLHDANDGPSKIKGSWQVDTGHLCRLAAKQYTPHLLARRGYALYDARGLLWVEFWHSEIIHEEKWSCSLSQQVVDAMIHQVVANGIEATCLRGQEYFGADAIC